MEAPEEKNIDFEGDETLNPSSLVVEEAVEDVYPDAVLNIARETGSVFQLKRRWEKTPSMLDLTPPFQRNLVWSSKQKSELIESIIMGIPLPAFYVKENPEGVYVVVDGKQRLSTLFDFIDGKFKLEGLSILKDHVKSYFSDLSPIEQNKIEDYTLTINVIKAPTSDRVTFDLFDRVNRGGTNLNNQEMRNALYQGTSTRLIDELAENMNFLDATENTIPPKHMKDRYLILRFLAFYMWNEHLSVDIETGLRLEYKSNLEDFLGKTMAYLNNLTSQDKLIARLKIVFNDCMYYAAKYVVPLGGFRLPSDGGRQKRPINMAFFESFSYLIAKMDEVNENHVREVYFSILSNKEYVNSLTYSVDSRKQTYLRYEIIKSYLKKTNPNVK
ncbi:Protein of unknown function DUF262 [Bacteroides finegoldii]|jgi:hypothetical protein|uniref:GmrSD restriction endonucleases N-terminal domain-containing protein n=1 Tax=Bacteroides finegoldii CL09T03C10 TaxID=997888 RepID=K5DF80_9BACE|nr:DUF262 domain-containing protein [Bacteroides finegoldii]EKJ91623.1 hypothetical protein HMPREF1057_00458 [Bacteroides finegoldii CL09T03C10]